MATASFLNGYAVTTATLTHVSLPNRLVVDQVQFSPDLARSRTRITARFHVSDTRGFSISGALVYALGLPYGWVYPAAETGHRRDGLGDDLAPADAEHAAGPGRSRPLRPRAQAG